MTRPVLRYHGGKWRLAPWIISHFPPHRIYTEAYGGGASVLLRKERTYSEVYNDMDGEIVNVFRVLRNPEQARQLREMMRLTPFSRTEFKESYVPVEDPVEQARRTMFRSFAGFGSGGATGHNTGFRNNATRSGTIPAHDWARLPGLVDSWVHRLRGVVIENRPADVVLRTFDSPETLHYVDPPYPFDTRAFSTAKRTGYNSLYRHELADDEHRDLAEVLHSLEGAVVLSGYPCEMYDSELYPDWHRGTTETHADGASDRIEVLWMNDAAVRRRAQKDLFTSHQAA